MSLPPTYPVAPVTSSTRVRLFTPQETSQTAARITQILQTPPKRKIRHLRDAKPRRPRGWCRIPGPRQTKQEDPLGDGPKQGEARKMRGLLLPPEHALRAQTRRALHHFPSGRTQPRTREPAGL